MLHVRWIALLLPVRDGVNMFRLNLFVAPAVIGVIIGMFAYALGMSAAGSLNLGLAAFVGGLFVEVVRMG